MSYKGLHADTGYGIVHKDVALFSNLTMKARGLYAILACWPQSERLSISAVLRIVPDGRDAVTNAWRELQEAGLIGPKKSGANVRVTRKMHAPKEVLKPKKSDAIFGVIPKKHVAPPLIVSTTNELELISNTESERVSILRKSSVGCFEAFMALKVAIDADAAGVDVEHYYNAILEWSNKKNKQLRTAHGWVDTIKGAIRRDKQAGRLKMKGHEEAQHDDQLRFLQLGR